MVDVDKPVTSPDGPRASRRQKKAAAFELDALRARKESLEQRLEHLKQELVRLLGKLEVQHAVDSKPPVMADPEPVVQAPTLPPGDVEADRLIRTIDEEIVKLDAMLGELAARERKHRREGFSKVGSPHRSEEFTLYAKPKAKAAGPEAEYYFSVDEPWDAYPVPMPDGYEVAKDPRTGTRSLVEKKAKSKGGKNR